jgi:creatinine amidohydrolase
MERHIDRLHWKELRKLVPDKISTVLLPVGILEAHGASALGTDIIIPDRLADLVAGKVGALVAPSIPYGVPGSLAGYPGTVGVRAETFTDYVLDVLHGLASTGFRQIFILNGHGGNNAALKEAAQLTFEGAGACVAVIHWWIECDDLARETFGGSGGHGGADETAMMLAIDPALVPAPKAVDPPYRVRPSVVSYPAPSSALVFGEDAAAISFDETKAKAFLGRVAARLEEIIEEIEARWAEI